MTKFLTDASENYVGPEGLIYGLFGNDTIFSYAQTAELYGGPGDD